MAISSIIPRLSEVKGEWHESVRKGNMLGSSVELGEKSRRIATSDQCTSCHGTNWSIGKSIVKNNPFFGQFLNCRHGSTVLVVQFHVVRSIILGGQPNDIGKRLL
jgi:hypothetical protein